LSRATGSLYLVVFLGGSRASLSKTAPSLATMYVGLLDGQLQWLDDREAVNVEKILRAPLPMVCPHEPLKTPDQDTVEASPAWSPASSRASPAAGRPLGPRLVERTADAPRRPDGGTHPFTG
jgi:hypothetical protein